jgi:hypothetical protein
MAELSICSAGPEMDIGIRPQVTALGGRIQRIQPHPLHHEFFITVPDGKLPNKMASRKAKYAAPA